MVPTQSGIDRPGTEPQLILAEGGLFTIVPPWTSPGGWRLAKQFFLGTRAPISEFISA